MSQEKKEKQKKQGLFRVLYNNALMLGYIFRYTPGLLVYTFVFMIVTGVRGVVNSVYAVKYFLDCIQLHRTAGEILGFIAFFAGINLVDSLLGTYYENVYLPKQKLVLARRMQSELFQKAKGIELAAYDNPKLYNDFIWATERADGEALNVLENFGEFVRTLTRLGGFGTIILSSDSLGVYVVLASLALSFLAEQRINKLEFELSLQQKPVQRERDYTSRVLYLPDYAKEVRLSHISDLLIDNFRQTNQKLIAVIKQYGRKSLGWSLFQREIAETLLLDGLYMGYLCYQTAVKGAFTYGTFMGLYSGGFNLRNSLKKTGVILSRFRKESLYIEHLLEFLHYESAIQDCISSRDMPKESALMELRDVCFSYDGTEEVLHNIDLTIHPGEKIALVGYNGAGKSTLVKLLMRLYDVSQGEICLDGHNIKEYRVEEYRDYFGVVFQDYQLFAGTIAENVKMEPTKESDRENIEKALEKSGFSEKLATLPKGIDTMLTREFEKSGTNLSGGEAQKVAIARTFMKESFMVILDEPSSALDPISEYYVNQSMLKAAEDKTVIFISHRLSTTRIADRILMLERGRIIEQGSHEELMKKNGKYAQMFHMQAEKYQQG